MHASRYAQFYLLVQEKKEKATPEREPSIQEELEQPVGEERKVPGEEEKEKPTSRELEQSIPKKLEQPILEKERSKEKEQPTETVREGGRVAGCPYLYSRLPASMSGS
jgi:hypothetical protein